MRYARALVDLSRYWRSWRWVWGFFAGLMVSEEAMLKTGETYLDEQNFYDFRLMSTLGFDDDDVAALRDADEVTAADGAYQVDALVSDGGDEEKVGRFHSITEDVNKLALKDGRLPENAGECVVDSSFFEGAGIGDTVTIADGQLAGYARRARKPRAGDRRRCGIAALHAHGPLLERDRLRRG